MKILNFTTRQKIYKLFAVVSIAALLGMVIGVSQVKAEYLYNVYVAGAGNVAMAATNGNYPVAGDLHGIGVSTSSTTLGYLYAENRNWHQSTDGGRTKIAKFKSWYNSTGGVTSPDKRRVISVPLAELTINRPFIYAIRERATGLMLFLGRVTNPQ